MSRVKGLLSRSWVCVLLVILLGTVMGQIFVNTVLFSSNVVGDSMNPTYIDTERVWVNRLATPKRGDIIIVDEGEKYVIKRVVGMPGDTIQIIDGIVYLNGVRYTENYIKDGNTHYDAGVASEPITLGDDEYFMLGDNRVISRDSRAIGAITEDMIVGVVID